MNENSRFFPKQVKCVISFLYALFILYFYLVDPLYIFLLVPYGESLF